MASKRDIIIESIIAQTEPFHPSKIAGLTGASVPYVTNVIIALESTGQLTTVKEGRKTFFKVSEDEQGDQILIKDPQNNKTNIVSTVNPITEFDVVERFDYVEKFAQLVIEGITPSLFFTGVAGIGKTHIIRKMLKENDFREGDQYNFIKGHSSPFGLFSILYFNRNRITIFDDCDKAFENELSANILKGALDSYDRRVITWAGRGVPKDSDVESTFEFKGQIIFISNKPLESMDEAIRSRTLCISLDMNRQEIIEHMRGLLNKIETKQPMKLKIEVLNYLESVKDNFVSFNLRTLIKAIRVRARYSEDKIWKNMIRLSSHSE